MVYFVMLCYNLLTGFAEPSTKERRMFVSNNPKIPKLATGTVIPGTYQQYLDLKEKYEKKSQRRHDYIMLILSSLLGSVFGFASSIIFWLISK